MSIRLELLEIADELTQNAQAQADALQAELCEIEAKKRDVEAKLDAAKGALNRLARFEPEFGEHLQCPHCWFANGRWSTLNAIGGGTQNRDFFRCEIGHDFSRPT